MIDYAKIKAGDKFKQMREAINAIELALNALQIDDIVDAWDGAMDTVKIRVPLGALRRLAKCYPELNRIINDPNFERP